MFSELNSKENPILMGYSVALEKERIAIIGRMMPGFIHEMNGSIGSLNTLSSFLEDRLMHTKTKLLKNELKKSDFEEFIQTFEETIANALLVCQHANDHSEHVRKISNIQNRPDEHIENLSELIDAFKASLKPYLKKNNLKMEVDIVDDTSLICDFSWLLTALFLWLQLFIEEKAKEGSQETDSIVKLHLKMVANQFELVLETSHVFSDKVIDALTEKNAFQFETYCDVVSENCIFLWLCLNTKLSSYGFTYHTDSNGRFALNFEKTEEIR